MSEWMIEKNYRRRNVVGGGVSGMVNRPNGRPVKGDAS